jgi:hypothetical protein
VILVVSLSKGLPKSRVMKNPKISAIGADIKGNKQRIAMAIKAIFGIDKVKSGCFFMSAIINYYSSKVVVLLFPFKW